MRKTTCKVRIITPINIFKGEIFHWYIFEDWTKETAASNQSFWVAAQEMCHSLEKKMSVWIPRSDSISPIQIIQFEPFWKIFSLSWFNFGQITPVAFGRKGNIAFTIEAVCYSYAESSIETNTLKRGYFYCFTYFYLVSAMHLQISFLVLRKKIFNLQGSILTLLSGFRYWNNSWMNSFSHHRPVVFSFLEFRTRVILRVLWSN